MRRWVWAPVICITAVSVLPMAARAAPQSADGVLVSFDGTPIAFTLFLPEGADASHPVPVVFVGSSPNEQGGRIRTPTGLVDVLAARGYSVLTWDARGAGDSGGEAGFNALDAEVLDVRALIDVVAARPEILRDRPGDPRMAMVGSVYGGSIQLMTAAADRRVDAIAPQQTWNDFDRSFRPGGVLKQTWPLLGYGASMAFAAALGVDSPAGPQTGALRPEVHQAVVEAVALNDWSPETVTWWGQRSPANFIGGAPGVPGVRAPTLVIQAVNDPLFGMNEGVATYQQLQANHVRSRLLVICSVVPLRPMGSSCATGDQAARVEAAILAWLDRHLLRADVPSGPPVAFQTQDGTFHDARSLGLLTAVGHGEVTVVGEPAATSGAVTAPRASMMPTAHRVALAVPPGATLLGTPRIHGSISGVGEEAFLFFKLVAVDAAGAAVVLSDQAAPIRVRALSDATQDFAVDLGGVSWTTVAGQSLHLEVATTSNDHTASRTPFTADLVFDVLLPICGRSAGPFTC